ncbi:MAG: hypothetical protein WDO18_22115 [Acidobacteriota bacterium]
MADHTDRTISIILAGKTPNAELRLDDFLDQMQALRLALRETERVVSGNDPSLYLRIKSLQKNSPAEVVLEAVSEATDERADPVYANHVVRSLTTNLRVISKRHRLPANVEMTTLDAYRELAEPAEKRGMEVSIKTGNHSVEINKNFRETLDAIIGEDEYSYGSVTGKIEAINLHARNRRFQIFPVVGASRVTGTFKSRDRKRFAGLCRQVRHGLGTTSL